jgi:hypothetical protein
MKHTMMPSFGVRMTTLAVGAGLLYSSWPLGYILNPSVAHNGLASALEALHQPYNWVFIIGDVGSSLLVILLGGLLWRHYHGQKHQRFLGAVVINMLIFACGTIADTLLPEHCLPEAVSCPSWQHDHLLLAHGIFSIVASLCLFLAILIIWWRNRTALWSAVMLGYTVFGLWSLYEAVSPTTGNFSQHYYITLCSIAIALIPYGIQRTFLVGESPKKSRS